MRPCSFLCHAEHIPTTFPVVVIEPDKTIKIAVEDAGQAAEPSCGATSAACLELLTLHPALAMLVVDGFVGVD